MKGKYTLKQLRAGKGLSQQETAKLIGISLTAWGKWENGQSQPTRPNIDKILKEFDVDYKDVIFLKV